MADQVISGIQIQVGLDSGKFEASGVRLTAQARKISEAFNQISGLKADQKLQAVERAVEKLGGVANLSAPQVARLRAEIDKLAAAGAKIPKSLQLPKIDTSSLSGIDKAITGIGSAQLSGLTGPLGSVGTALTALGPAGIAAAVGVGAVTVAVGAAISAVVQYGSEVQDIAEKTGFSTDAVQELGYAVRQSGGDFENVAKSATIMERQIAAGASVFKTLGLDVANLREQRPEEAFLQVAEAIRKLDDPYKQAQAAAQAFGKAGVELLPAIRAGLKDLSAEAHEFGQVLSKDGVEAGDKFGDALERASKAWTVLKAAVGGRIVGTLQLDVILNNLTKAVANPSDLLHPIDAENRDRKKLEDQALAAATARSATGIFAGAPDLKLPGLEEQVRLLSKVGLESQIAKKDLADFEAAAREADQELKALAGALGQHFDALAKARAKREDRSASQDALLGGNAAAQFESEKIQGAIVDIGGVSELSAKQVEFLAQKFFDLSKAGVEIPQDLGAISEGANKLNFDDATNSMAELEDQTIEVIKALAALGQGPLAGFSGEQIDLIFGRTGDAIDHAKEATFDWHRALEDIANLASTLPGVFGKAFGGILSGVAGIGSALKNIGGIGGLKDSFSKGIGGAISGLGAIGSIAGAAIGIGKSIIGLFKKDPVKQAQKQIAKDLGHGISEEFAKQAIDLSKALGISLQEAAKKLEKDQLLGKLSDLQGKAKAGAGQILSGLGGFGQIKGAADAQGRIFAKQFWAVVAVEGFGPAVEAFKATFDKLSPELQAAIPADLQNIFKFAENSDFKGALDGVQALTEGFKGTVSVIGLSKETLADYGAVAQAAFDQAKAGALAEGATEAEAQRAALQAIVPLLAAERDAALQAGIALDANTQALLDQAEAAGISIPVDPLLQVVDILKEIAATLQQIGGIDVNPKVHVTTTTTGDPIPEPGGSTKRPSGFAVGGLGRFSKQGQGAILHGFEAVLPLDDKKNFSRVFSDIVRFRPELVADALGRIVSPALSTIPHFAGGGFTDTGTATDTGGFGGLGTALGGGSVSITAPITINVQVEALGDLSAVGDQVAGAIDAEVPVIMDALAKTIRREIATQ